MWLTELSSDRLFFPPPERALRKPNGLLATGGDLCVERMLLAYQNGIFPWFNADEPILWWSPDPRAVLFPHQFHLSRSMKRFHHHSPYSVTLDQAFCDVVSGCAEDRAGGTWITKDVKHAWRQLFKRGYAHSAEVWQKNELVGGLYGLSLGQLFCGESMFSRRPNASKTALLVFCEHFHGCGGRLIDCQVLNTHTASLGAVNIPRTTYLSLLYALITQPIRETCWQKNLLFAKGDAIFSTQSRRTVI